MDALSQKHFVTMSELKLHQGSFYVNVHHPYHTNSQCGLDVTVSMQTQIKPKCKNVSLTERTICPDNLVRQSSEYHTLLFIYFFLQTVAWKLMFVPFILLIFSEMRVW